MSIRTIVTQSGNSGNVSYVGRLYGSVNLAHVSIHLGWPVDVISVAQYVVLVDTFVR